MTFLPKTISIPTNEGNDIEYIVLGKLSRLAYGKGDAYCVLDLQNGQRYKYILVQRDGESSDLSDEQENEKQIIEKDAWKEYSFLKEIYFGSDKEGKNKISYLYNYHEGGVSLENFILNLLDVNGQIPASFSKDIFVIFIKIAEAVEALRSDEIIHACLEPENILLYEDKNKYSIYFKGGVFSDKISPSYASIRQLKGDDETDKDLKEEDLVYNLSLILFFMLTGKRVWNGSEYKLNKLKKAFRPTIWVTDGWRNISFDIPKGLVPKLESSLRGGSEETIVGLINYLTLNKNKKSLSQYLGIRNQKIALDEDRTVAHEDLDPRSLFWDLGLFLEEEIQRCIENKVAIPKITSDSIILTVEELNKTPVLPDLKISDSSLDQKEERKKRYTLHEVEDENYKRYALPYEVSLDYPKQSIVYSFAMILFETITTQLPPAKSLAELPKDIKELLGKRLKIFQKALYGTNSKLETYYNNCSVFYTDLLNNQDIDFNVFPVGRYLKTNNSRLSLSKEGFVREIVMRLSKELFKPSLIPQNLYFSYEGTAESFEIIYKSIDLTFLKQVIKNTPYLFFLEKDVRSNWLYFSEESEDQRGLDKLICEKFSSSEYKSSEVYQLSKVWLYLQTASFDDEKVSEINPEWLQTVIRIGLKKERRGRWRNKETFFKRIKNKNEELVGDQNEIRKKNYWTGDQGEYPQPKELEKFDRWKINILQQKFKIMTILAVLISVLVIYLIYRPNPATFPKCNTEICKYEKALEHLDSLGSTSKRLDYCLRLDDALMLPPDTSVNKKKEASILNICLTASAPTSSKKNSRDIKSWLRWSDAMNLNEYNTDKLNVLDTISGSCSGNRLRSLSDCSTEVELCGFLRKALNDECTLSTVLCLDDPFGILDAQAFYQDVIGYSECD